MRNEQQLRDSVLTSVRRVFPYYPVRIEELGDNEPGFSVGVFDVPKEDVKQVEEFIFDLDDKLCEGTNTVILPIVRNRQVTEAYYPNLLTLWVNAGETEKGRSSMSKVTLDERAANEDFAKAA